MRPVPAAPVANVAASLLAADTAPRGFARIPADVVGAVVPGGDFEDDVDDDLSLGSSDDVSPKRGGSLSRSSGGVRVASRRLGSPARTGAARPVTPNRATRTSPAARAAAAPAMPPASPSLSELSGDAHTLATSDGERMGDSRHVGDGSADVSAFLHEQDTVSPARGK